MESRSTMCRVLFSPDVRIHALGYALKTTCFVGMSCVVCLFEGLCAPHRGYAWLYRGQLFLGTRNQRSSVNRPEIPLHVLPRCQGGSICTRINGQLRCLSGIIALVFSLNFFFSVLPVVVLCAFLMSALMLRHCQSDYVE